MFDVVWTDPDRELVGERRARKENEKKAERESIRSEREKEKQRPGRNSVSTRSSSSSSDKPFGFFGSMSLKRTMTPHKSKAASTTSSLSTLTTTTVETKKSGPPPVASPELHAVELPTDPIRPIPETVYVHDPFLELGTHSPISSSRDSVFSKWTEQSAPTPASTYSVPESTAKSSMIQTLGPSSYITKSTEVTILPRTPETDISQLITEVRISADGFKENPPTPPRSPVSLSIAMPRFDSPVNLIPGAKSPDRPSSPSWAMAFKPNNPDAWRPPEAWDCGLAEAPGATIHEIMEEAEAANDDSEMSLDLHGMQRELRRMAAASTDIILIRLKETWGPSADAALYKELEMEKKRWMLSALRHMDDPDVDTSKPSAYKIEPNKAQKVLALYESQATTSYLAAQHHAQQVYHLSSAPLSHVLFPNVHPILMPAVSAAAFPVAAQLFEAVYSLALPALLSSQEIPQVLKHVRRCLVPGGTLHLTIVDPMPCATTLGPRLRTWLEDNLLLNLERQFRCINPSKLFPIWLHDASLRSDGSTLTTVKFQAVPDTKGSIPGLDHCTTTDRENKLELRSIVGRMLWKEVWGTFVAAEKWWWEDPACLEECIEKGTYWEYHLIEAVRGP